MALGAGHSLGGLDLQFVRLISSSHEWQQLFDRHSSNLAFLLMLLMFVCDAGPFASQGLEHADSAAVAALRRQMLIQLAEHNHLVASALRAGDAQPALDALSEAVA